jgi:L-ascorbate metabolism protein UlaG (beta-lactamase superfamily)
MAQLTITWLGHSFFKLQAGDVTVVIDPYDAATGLKPPRFNADLLLITHEHHDHNNRATVMGQPFEVSTPGEYEVGGVTVYGVAGFHDTKSGEERGRMTMYRVEMEGIRVVHLGDIGQDKLTSEQLEVLDGVDVLLIPVGGKYTVNGQQAASLVDQLEPRIVVPMHYKIPGLKIDIEGPEAFLKAIGLPAQKEQKLKLQKKDLNPDQRQVVLLEPDV